MSSVVLDFTPIELLWITVSLPTSLILFTKVVKPLSLYLLPTSISASRILLPPSDGFNYLPSTPSPSTTSTSAAPSTSTVEGDEKRTKKIWIIFLLALIEAGFYILSAIWGAIGGEGSWEEMFTKIWIAGLWTYAGFSPLISRPKTAPFLLFFIYISFTLCAFLSFVSFGLHLPSPLDLPFELTFLLLNLLINIILLTLVVSFPLSLPSPEDTMETKKVGKSEITQPISPEGSVTLFAWISFSWVGPIIKQGSIAKLGYGDVWRLTSTMQSEGVRRSALELTSKRMIPRIFFNNSLDLVLSLTLGLTSSTLAYAAPFFLKQILTSLEPPPIGMPADPTLRQSAFIYAALAFFAQLLRAEVDLQQLWHERRAIVRCRSQLMGEVYEKALKRRDLSGFIANKEVKELKDKDGKIIPVDEKEKKKREEMASGGSTGKIVNLMSSDAQRVANQLMGLSSLVAAPFELVVAIIFLYQLLGWTCIAGLSVMAISLPLNHMLVTRRVKMHRAVLASRDKRMDVLNEFIQAIRFVKYSASEGQWLDRVFTARTYELSQLLRTRMNNLMIGVIWSFTPDVVILIAFTLFTKVMGKELTVPVAFTSLALFALVRAPMSMLPMSITSLLQTYVSIERLEAFLQEPEVESWVSALRPEDEPTCTSLEISITNATFKYQDITTKSSSSNSTSNGKDKNNKKDVAEVVVPEVVGQVEEMEPTFELSDISINFPLGKLSLICGPTGSGKSSVFLALLGEMDRIDGTVNLPKGLITSIDASTGLYEGVAYTAQLPWLEHASIKNNILFGSPYEEERYNSVLDACALRPDLEMFAAGGNTEIGEKGISLSGGQKARVALARAVYSRAKTVLLDDPLSAIDMHTARHVFNQCLKGPLMAHRTIILITHHVALCLSGAEYIVRMSSGQVETQGPVSEYDRSEFASELLDDAAEEAEVEALLKPSTDPASTTESVVDPVVAASTTASSTTLVAETKGDGKLVDEELRATGRVKWKVYKTYLSAAGWDAWAMIVILLLASRGFRVVDRYVLKIWGESYRASVLYLPMQALSIMDPQRLYENFDITSRIESLGLPTLPSASDNVNPYLYLYAFVCIVNLLLSVLVMLAGYRGSFAAARILFTQTLTRVAYAPFRYYDTTPTGRILNRFSTDFQTIDTSLTDQVRTSMGYAFSFIVNVFVIIAVSPSFIPPAILIVFAYVKLSLSYVKTSRDLRRLESSARSPVYSKFGETLSGIVTCRAFGAERRFLSELFESVDAFLSAHYASMMVNRYLLWRFDFLGALAVVITTFLSLAAGASPGPAALAITSAQTLVQSVYWLCRYISALEVDLNAVERVTELLETPQEPPMLSEKRPPANWPSDIGGIVIENLVIGYASTLPPVIKDVSLEIKPRQKVGVVGRTGSGKSTFALSLLRFVDPTSGRILIDGIDITTIGLLDLRSRLTLIPQEAVLFTGTVRSNLDPFELHTDSECMDALERVQMINHSSGNASHRGSNLPSRTGSPIPGSSSNHTNLGSRTDQLVADALSSSGAGGGSSDSASEITRVDSGRLGVTLETKVSQGGHNFSAGQRQLLAMARALLRNSNIIIMDESTASVDFATDAKIQHTIREEFADSLVITIAHRLRTVIDYDQILVLDNGRLAEYGTPKDLLSKEGGSFRKMCEQSSDWSELRAAANANSGGTRE